jgi:hypothetical protein
MKTKTIASVLATATLLGVATVTYANRGDGNLGVVYVWSQGLYYDTFVTADPLPNKGPFQKLVEGETDFGPGDPGYRGGRWWIDDGDGVRGDEDTFLLCPLLPPGRPIP